jgi:hypothetical protein
MNIMIDGRQGCLIFDLNEALDEYRIANSPIEAHSSHSSNKTG